MEEEESNLQNNNNKMMGMAGADAAFSKLLEANTVIERLDLSGMLLGNTGVVSLASALHQNSTLRELSFRQNETITKDEKDKAIAALEEMLEHNKVLGKLSIQEKKLK